jgi:hypothetical protein
MTKAMNIQVKGCTALVGYGQTSETQHIALSICMTDKQIKKAIITLLGTLPADQIHDLLMEEFPTVMQSEES